MASKARKRKADESRSRTNKMLAVSVRLSPETMKRLERYEKHLRQLRPNVRITRAGLLRAVIEKGLIAFELSEKSNAKRDDPEPLFTQR